MKLIKGNENAAPEKKTAAESKMTLIPPSLSKGHKDKLMMDKLLKDEANED